LTNGLTEDCKYQQHLDNRFDKYLSKLDDNFNKYQQHLVESDNNLNEYQQHLLEVSNTFKDCDAVKHAIKQFAKQHNFVKSINEVLKKHVDHDTLLKELVKAVEDELEKELQYTRIKDYYSLNLSVGLLLVYETIDDVLKNNLASIPLSFQQAQMNQALLYQETLISIN
ncbi:3648_t:CDS:2, partial [Racocetra fulgida]